MSIGMASAKRSMTKPTNIQSRCPKFADASAHTARSAAIATKNQGRLLGTTLVRGWLPQLVRHLSLLVLQVSPGAWLIKFTVGKIAVSVAAASYEDWPSSR